MSKSAAASGDYAGNLALYEKLVATCPGVERKGDTMPYTSLNGHMFSYLAKTGELVLRLPDGVREEFLKKYDTALSTQYGIVQKEYAMVPPALLRKTAELKKYFVLSRDYVATLKPKPAKKKAAK